MVGALFLIAIGAGLGYAVWSFRLLQVSQVTAIAAGALGALIFGTLIKLLAGLLMSVIAAALGAFLLLLAAQSFERRKRR